MSTPIPFIHGSTCLRAARTISRQATCPHQSQHFSSSAPRWPRGVKGTNKLRGLSVVRARGPIGRRVQSIKPSELPVPVMDPAKRAKIETNDSHGLWGFFNQDKEALTTPKELNAHGRAWTKKELRIKSLSDMHILWWKCHLELNRLATEAKERKRIEPGYGKYELDNRRDTLKDTQKAIRETLQERYEAWQEAKDIINKDHDPDVTVNSEGLPVWRDSADPYEVDEMEGAIEPMTRSEQGRRPL